MCLTCYYTCFKQLIIRRPSFVFLLLVNNCMPISVKMLAILVHSTRLCCFNRYVEYADYKS